MMLHRKLATVLGFSLLTAGGSAHALPALSPKQKSATKPRVHHGAGKGAGHAAAPAVTPKTRKAPPKTRKVLPVPQQMQPISRGKPQPSPKAARALRNPNLLSKQRIAGVATRFAIDATAHDVASSTALTVRRPHRGPGAYLSFEGVRHLDPQSPADGLAEIDSGAELRRVRGTGPATQPAETPEMLARQFDPLHPAFPPSAETTLDGPHLAVHFRAAAQRDYVVSCRVRAAKDDADFGVRVVIDGAFSHMLPAIEVQDGRVSLALPRADRARGVELQIVAGLPWTGREGGGLGAVVAGQRRVVPFSVSRCDITPLS